MNNRLEGWQRLTLDNFLREVVPKRRGIWIKWSLGQGQTARRGSRAQELRFRRLERGWGLNGFEEEHKSWTILSRWQRVAMSRRLENKGRSDLERKSSWDAFQDWRTTRQANLWHDSRRLVRVLLRGCQVVLPYSRMGRTRCQIENTVGTDWKPGEWT